MIATPKRFRVPVIALAFAACGLLAAAQSPIQLTVDASQAPLKMVYTHEVIPVHPGPFTLLYPKWIPGEHQPDGPIGNVTGLHFSAQGKPIPWTRDLLDVFTFHVDIPSGVSALDVNFDYIESSSGDYTAGGSATAKLVDVNWNQNLLYPAGVDAHTVMVDPKLVLPPEWQFGTALPVDHQSGTAVTFQPASLTLLIDSPVIAGEYMRKINITPPGEKVYHEWDIVADNPADLAVPPQLIEGMKNLVAQAGLLFGSRHYRDYHFLLTLSDYVAHFGLEHHESDDSRLPERVMLSRGGVEEVGFLLSHEYVHSWNGKFRRPADLASAPYEAPMETDLLWVYEGLTDFLGHVLPTRAGMWSEEDFRNYFASIAAQLGPGRPGRTWKPLLDTAVSIPGMFENGGPWVNWRRGSDYYEEGDLLWLEVATIIHDQSHGAKSIEDFLHEFYGGPNLGPQLKTYTFDQLCQALSQVQPYDWAGFFQERLNSLSPVPPLGGIEASGWKYELTSEGVAGAGDPQYSLGLQLAPDGRVADSLVGSPAYKAGIVAGMKVIGVNQRVYTPERLAGAILASPQNSNPIALLVENDSYLKTSLIDYHGGPKAPRLVRNPNRPDYLTQLLQPLHAH